MPYLLNRAAEVTSQAFQQHYRQRYGMLRTEWRVIFHLGRYGPLTAKSICSMANLHKTKVSRAVTALEEKRYLSRTTVPEDRRHEVLRLTRSGETVFSELTSAAETYNARLLARFTDEEADTLRRVLLRMIDTGRSEDR